MVEIINSFAGLSDEDQRKAFGIISNIMQSQIIGYIRTPLGTFEPAISPTETFMPLPSYGTSNCHYGDQSRFHRFPNGKTLSEMKDDGIKFHEWCKKIGMS